MCKTQTSVSHRSTESEVDCLDAGLRMDGIHPHFVSGIWSLTYCTLPKTNQYRDLLRDQEQRKHTNTKTKKHTNRDDLELSNVDHVTANAKRSHFGALLYILKTIKRLSKLLSKGRSPTMRYASRTHRVALDCLCDRINLGPKNTLIPKTQFADMWTRGSFTRHEWNHLLSFFQHHEFFNVLW